MPMWLISGRLRSETSQAQAEQADYKSAEQRHADVAQLAEQLICNQQVIGSSPIIGFLVWTISSVGQSNRLITGRSWVRVPDGPLKKKIWPHGSVGQSAALSRRRSRVRVPLGSFVVRTSNISECVCRFCEPSSRANARIKATHLSLSQASLSQLRQVTFNTHYKKREGSQLSWESICLTSRGSQVRALQVPFKCRRGGTGRRAGLKILLWRHSTGSIPVAGIPITHLTKVL